MIYGHELDDVAESNEKEGLKYGDESDDDSLHSIDMEHAPSSSLVAVNEKKVKFV